jgi:hypothetical protein
MSLTGGPLVSTTTNETQHIADQLSTENSLKTGFTGGGFNAATAKTDATLSAASTSLLVRDITNALSITVGAYILIKTVTDSALVKVTAITVAPGGSAPYTATYAIQMIVAPSGTIPTNTALGTFSGFTNAERTAKTATSSVEQPIMNYLITTLQTYINSRISRLNEQIAAMATNLDPDGTSAFTTATTNAKYL